MKWRVREMVGKEREEEATQQAAYRWKRGWHAWGLGGWDSGGVERARRRGSDIIEATYRT